MKRFMFIPFLFAALAAMALPALAQDASPITLTDTNPTVDVVISLPPQTSGALSLDLDQASVMLTDDAGQVVYYMADPRAHELSLEFLPDTGTHTLTLERLPGAAEANVNILTQPELLQDTSALPQSDAGILTLSQQHTALLSPAQPGDMLGISIPQDTLGTIQTAFENAPVTTQLVDTQGSTVATLYGGHIGSMSLTLDGGDYSMSLLSSGTAADATANVSIIPAAQPEIASALEIAEQPDAAQDTQLASAQTAPEDACNLFISASSVNLRSGPGTGYSILNYAYAGTELEVGGTNTDGLWLLVADENGDSAWIAGQLGTTEGNCSNLPTYDIPYRGAPEQQIIYAPADVITMPAQTITVDNGGSSGSSSGGSSDNNGGGSNNNNGGGGSVEDDDHEDEQESHQEDHSQEDHPQEHQEDHEDD